MIIAFDKSSVRSYDVDGRLHIARTHISKAGINEYLGNEIPDYAKFGLKPDKIYRVFRPPEELEKSAPTFARLQILREHIPVTVDAPQPDLIIGAIGSDIIFADPYLDADLVFWDKAAIAGIENGQIKELSCAYRYTPVVADGIGYDIKISDIIGNHLALVETGRVGHDVVVADSAKQLSTAGNNMPKARTNYKQRDSIKATVIAADATLSPQQLDNVIDALLDVEQEPEPKEQDNTGAGDESPLDRLRSLLKGKVDDNTIEEACALFSDKSAAPPPKDVEPIKDKEITEQKMKTAMDSLRAEMVTHFKGIEAAKEAVRPTVGNVIGMDSAEQIYGFALDQLRVDYKGIKDPVSLHAIYKAATSGRNSNTTETVDYATTTNAVISKFPDLKRFA